MPLSHRLKSQIIVVLLFIFFCLPLILALFFFKYPSLVMTTRNNRGVLIQPPMHLANWHHRRWVIGLQYMAECKVQCQRLLKLHQNIIIATGKNQMRVMSTQLTAQTAEKLIQAKLPFANQNGATYFIDPNGNLMMGYPSNVKPKDMLKDLKRLLRSNVQ